MLLNDTKKISYEELIASQARETRSSDFTGYVSKKELSAAKALDEKTELTVLEIKKATRFDLHQDKNFLVVSRFYSKEKKYEYVVVDLRNFNTYAFAKIAGAKAAVRDTIAEEAKATAKTTEDKKNK
jgi:hypothetical protein